MTEKTTVVVKLHNRDEFIAKVIEHDSHIDVFKPIQIFHVPDSATGQMKMGMAPYMPYVMDELIIFTTAVAVIAIPQPQLATQYAELTGDIIVPPSQIILG